MDEQEVQAWQQFEIVSIFRQLGSWHSVVGVVSN